MLTLMRRLLPAMLLLSACVIDSDLELASEHHELRDLPRVQSWADLPRDGLLWPERSRNISIVVAPTADGACAWSVDADAYALVAVWCGGPDLLAELDRALADERAARTEMGFDFNSQVLGFIVKKPPPPPPVGNPPDRYLARTMTRVGVQLADLSAEAAVGYEDSGY